ncbi:hypothetical protein [Streptomyces sp. NPDC004728]|uniref:hypothetical protein n=1 Tax=Streptomyces sp. NPDC004728 TaxID=3154289 RepID=UPI0033BC4516
MNVSLRKTVSRRGRGAGRWLAREPRRWPVSVRMVLVAVIAVVGFTLVGPAATASAAPPPPSPASDSGREPSRWERLQWYMHEAWAGDALDGHDPYYKWKLARQIGTKRFLERGISSFSLKDDLPKFMEDVEEFKRRSKETPDGLRRQRTELANEIHDLNQKIDRAQTLAEREKLESDREVVRKQEKDVARRYRKLMATQPDAERVKARIQGLDTKISDLRKKITSLEEETKKSRPDRREKLRQLDTARANLAEAEAERRRLQGPPDDDSDPGGTRTTPRDPKQPPKGPGSTNPTTTSTTPTTSKGTKSTTATGPTVTPKGTKSSTVTGPTVTPKGTKSTTVTGPTVTPKGTKSSTVTGPTLTPKGTTGTTDPTMSWKGWNSLKTPKTGFRGSTGTNQMADAIAGVIADGISQDYAAHLDSRNQQLLEQARKDPALAKRIIDDYNEIKDNNDIEVLFRAFDTSKGFTQDATREVAPELIKSQKALDTAKAIADKSNADPFYQQARTECAGYDTCVTERTAKLRKQNAKAIADSTKKAKESNADPFYQQARTECAGYDTCVTDRTAKLRKQNVKAIADSTKKAKESNADPLYQQARTECGGYDTCVTDRVAKLRDQKKTTTATSTRPRTTDVHKTTTAKTGQTNEHKNAKAVAESTRKAKKSNADPLYQQARTECGGYDTCVTDRVAKLRDQKKTTTATTTTPTGQHKQSPKKTQTPDYRGKGGVKASAA